MANLRRHTMEHAGLGYTPGYCPACLDKWAGPRTTGIGDKKIPLPPPRLHPTCQAQLEKLSES